MKALKNKFLDLIKHNDEKVEALLLNNFSIWLVNFDIADGVLQLCINGFLLLEYRQAGDDFSIGGYRDTKIKSTNGINDIELAKHLLDYVNNNFNEIHKIVRAYYKSLIKG